MATLVAALLVAGACSAGSSSGGVVQWRDLTLRPPSDWIVYEQTDTVLGIANAPLGGEGVRGTRAVAAQFTHEPRTLPDDWRRLVAELGGDLEVDESIDVDGIPSTRLIYTWVTNGVPTREMVVLVPARGIVILMQPVVEQNETDGPDRFLDHRDVFDEILSGIDFGAPVRS